MAKSAAAGSVGWYFVCNWFDFMENGYKEAGRTWGVNREKQLVI